MGIGMVPVALRQGRTRRDGRGLHQLPDVEGAVRGVRRRAHRRRQDRASRNGRARPISTAACRSRSWPSAGRETLRHGPMKPMGLTNAHNPTVKAYAVVQLRQDNALGTLYNMVGFQTKLKHGEQKRIFRTIPGLENAEFARLGGLHRNTYINSPTAARPRAAAEERPPHPVRGPDHGLRGLCGERRRRPRRRAGSRPASGSARPSRRPRRRRRWARSSATSPAGTSRPSTPGRAPSSR